MWMDSPKGLVISNRLVNAEAIVLKHGQGAGDELSAVHLSFSLRMTNYAHASSEISNLKVPSRSEWQDSGRTQTLSTVTLQVKI